MYGVQNQYHPGYEMKMALRKLALTYYPGKNSNKGIKFKQIS